ncbi:radical SAM protein, partial [Candidatus Pacearchaeota archaeon]|nr:radical SAM protein [Candidatus Pacearchaeota archaeon]
MFESLMNESSLKALYRFFLPQKSRPSYLLFFVTSRCEASCGHCFYWRNINRNETELTLKEIECFARILGPMVQITLTGGSPELRDDLPELALILARFCRPINMTLCSNGNEPNKLYKIVETILRRIPNFRLTLDISLDGLNGEHDKIRGVPGLFERAVQSFYALENLKKTYPGLRLGLGLCVSGLNEGTAVKTANWAMDNLPLDNLTPVLVRGEPRNPKAIHCNPDIFLQIAQEVKTRLL